jgi:5-methylcytosine-specific restriction endonuclease McrA
VDLKRFLVQGLRRLSYKWPARSEALKRARLERNCYLCNICKNKFTRKEVQLDHIDPIVDPNTGFTTWDSYISKMFCPAEGYQIICIPCHKEKTEQENIVRDSRFVPKNKKRKVKKEC